MSASHAKDASPAWPAPPGATVRPLAFADLAGWPADDHAAAWAPFVLGCRQLLDNSQPLRRGAEPPASFAAVCQQALRLDRPDSATARAFFERHFVPLHIVPAAGKGFLTGYFEPEVEGALEKSAAFSAPVYNRPADLVTLFAGDHPPGFDTGLSAARRTADGLVPYIERGDIYAGALAGQGLEALYLRDEAEVFIIQVQGSARVRLPDGRTTRLVYAGRTGHPYTSIGRILIEEGRIAQSDMSLQRLMGWLRANPAEARALMARNRSYVFFKRDDTLDPALGPIGGAGLPLTPGRSLAVDRSLWAYGLPVWIGTEIDTLEPQIGVMRRLMLAQDTGSAIVGPARADFYWGSGEEAGRRAGLTRHPLEFTVLWPKENPPEPTR